MTTSVQTGTIHGGARASSIENQLIGALVSGGDIRIAGSPDRIHVCADAAARILSLFRRNGVRGSTALIYSAGSSYFVFEKSHAGRFLTTRGWTAPSAMDDDVTTTASVEQARRLAQMLEINIV